MDIRKLKSFIYENKFIEQILTSIGCHSIRYHLGECNYYTCANATGDNKSAVTVYDNEFLNCINYTRKMVDIERPTDLFDLVSYTKSINFFEALKFVAETIGINYYYDFDESKETDLLQTLEFIESMKNPSCDRAEMPLKPIPEHILDYYKPYVNQMFYDDNISYETQQEFNIGYDEETNRITIPIYSAIGDLVGVKGRLFKKELDEDDVKYKYIEPCSRRKVLYGLYKTQKFITETKKVFIVEAEKGVLQLWSYGYRNCVATGGKKISPQQIEMLTRLGATIIFCFDKDVDAEELNKIANMFVEGIPIYAIMDKDMILGEKESPTDDMRKWEHLVKNNIYRIR